MSNRTVSVPTIVIVDRSGLKRLGIEKRAKFDGGKQRFDSYPPPNNGKHSTEKQARPP
jgi:hypothetical protein